MTTPAAPEGVHLVCVQPDEQAGAVRFRNAAGVQLVGVMLGQGSTGIVLGHELHSSLCEWIPTARELAERGYRVLAIDFGGFGESESAGRTLDSDVRAAAAELAQAGAEKVVLIGSSMGGTAMLAAAPRVDVPLAGVVSLSGPAVFGNLDGAAAAADITVPIFFAAGEFDGAFPDSARQMYEAARSKTKTLHIVDNRRHGTELLDDPATFDKLLAFLDRVAPPR